MVDNTIRWRQRLQILLRLAVFGTVSYAVFAWLNVVVHQAIRGYFGAAMQFTYSSREAENLVIVVVLGLIVLLFERRVIRWLVPKPRPECHECGYALKGLTSTRCPECGALLGAADEHTPHD